MDESTKNTGKAVFDINMNHSRFSRELRFWVIVILIVISGVISFFVAREEIFSSQVRLFLAYYSLISAFITFALIGIRLSMIFQIKPGDDNQIIGVSRIKHFFDMFN